MRRKRRSSKLKQRINDELQIHVHLLVTSANILGVIFNQRFNCDELIKSASHRIYALEQLKRIDSVTKPGPLQIYQCYILSVLQYEYKSALFTGLSAIENEKLEKIRKTISSCLTSMLCERRSLWRFSPKCYRKITYFITFYTNFRYPIRSPLKIFLPSVLLEVELSQKRWLL